MTQNQEPRGQRRRRSDNAGFSQPLLRPLTSTVMRMMGLSGGQKRSYLNGLSDNAVWGVTAAAGFVGLLSGGIGTAVLYAIGGWIVASAWMSGQRYRR